jgi:hypothetical protein
MSRRTDPPAEEATLPLVKLLVVAMLIAIVFSLGSALWQLARGTGDSSKMLRALTWRIALSVILFALLFVAYFTGLLTPLGAR